MNLESNCLLIAGEKSGEEHALSFLPELKRLCPQTHFWGVGGDDLAKTGMELVYHLKDFSSWGISEVIGRIPFYLKALKNIERLCVERNTKTAILIDFQTFNLKLAQRLERRGIKVLYYVAPQAWAWKSWRVKPLSRCAHTLFTILPFERLWFASRGVKTVRGVDHPLWRHYGKILTERAPRRVHTEIIKKPRLLLLPGSRRFEVSSLLPVFMETVQGLKKNYDLEISLVESPSVSAELFDPYRKDFDRIYKSEELSQALLNADFCLSASGTVTLACALFEVPTIVCYKTSALNEFIFRTFINYGGYVSLANLVHERRIYPELLQEKATAPLILSELNSWLQSEENYNENQKALAKTKELVRGELQDVPAYMAAVLKGER